MIIKNKINILLITAALVLIIIISGCPENLNETDDQGSSKNKYLPYTFESNTPIINWLTNSYVYSSSINGAVSTDATIDITKAKSGDQSLKITGTLPAGSSIYTAAGANFKINETLGLGTQDFSTKIISASVYVPGTGNGGGGDYIQIALYNSSNENVQGEGITSFSTDTWNDITMDVHEYIKGTISWGYDSTGGSPENVYKAVTEIAVKVGFNDGPDRTYTYNVDDVNWTNKSLSLRDLADAEGKKIGAAIMAAQLTYDSGKFADTLKTEFNTIVAENEMKWSYLEPAEGSFTFANADTIVNFAETNSMNVRGHVLLWHNSHQIPDYLTSKTYTPGSGSELETALTTHIEGILDHFGDKVYAWDVVNEVIIDPWVTPAPNYKGQTYSSTRKGLRNRSRTGSEHSLFASDENDDYLLKRAFYIADSKLTAMGIRDKVKLFACDYTNEEMGTEKADQFYGLIAEWVGEGVPIDGVGFQLHLSNRYTMPTEANIRNNIARFKALKPGFEVHFAEIDISITGTDSANLTNQANMYGTLMDICTDESAVTSFLTWGLTDKYSWLNSDSDTDYAYGLMFDSDYNPKPAYYSVQDELLE